MTLHSCFQPASLLPTPLPCKPGAAIRTGSRRVTHRPGDSVEELSRGTGTVQRSCPALRQSEGTWPPSFTYIDGWFTATATGSSPWPGVCSLASQTLQYQGTLHAGVGAAVPSTFPEVWILRRGQADQRRDTLEQLVLPSSLPAWCPKRGQGLHQQGCEKCTVVPCFRKKEGDMMLGMVVR